MRNSPFQIYNASAGSGKTYALATVFLKIVLKSPQNYKKILAITFTNKAVNEMKHRILDNLLEFSRTSTLENASPLFTSLSQELDWPFEKLKTTSATRLKEILHNYAFLDISTIDKFTHRLIRTFARDLKIPQNFEVVLDTDLLLQEAVARVISKAGKQQEFTSILLNFALDKIDDDRSWDISFDLLKIGRLLLDENNATHLKHISSKGLKDFTALQGQLKIKVLNLESSLKKNAESALNYIENCNLDHKDFPRETLPKHFLKIKSGEFSPTVLYKNQLEKNLRDAKILKSGVEAPSLEFSNELLRHYLYLKKQVYLFRFLQNIQNNLVPFALLNAIQSELKLIQKEKDQVSISEFNSIIANEIKNQPAPFIYERLGEKYRFYFIDEFQDTSQMQWENLIPLIGNALEGEDEYGSTGSLFLVGDAKQAIYRWRGGKAEQFLELANYTQQPFSLEAETKTLPKNYRSHEEIIKFNNSFFQSVSPLLENKEYREFFQQGNSQNSNDKKGGFVKLSFLEKDKEEFSQERSTFAFIEECLLKGYEYKDICIITRKKKHGILLVDFLVQKGVPTISSDSLLISSNPKVQFLIYLLRLVLQPNEQLYEFEILNFLSKNKIKKHEYIYDNLTLVESLLLTKYNFNFEKLRSSSVYDGLSYAIKVFDLAPTSDAHIFGLLDIAFEVEQKYGPDIPSFISYWDKKANSLSLSSPANMEAVKIMTIHKSKGLEFPIVIFPFANSNIFEEIDPKLWLPVNPDEFNGLGEVLVSKKQEVQEYNELYASIYSKDKEKLQLDAYNLLYVALTRPIHSLHIISTYDVTRNGEQKLDYYSGLFIHYLKEKGIWKDEQLTYEFGDLIGKIPQLEFNSPQKNIPYIYTQKNRPDFKVIAHAGMLWNIGKFEAINQGTVIHYIMGLIKKPEDLKNALQASLQKGFIKQEELNKIKTIILNIIDHPTLKRFFHDNHQVYNEQDLYLKDGTVLRPDRVTILNNEVHIIDYKTGKKSTSYHEQVFAYADAYIQMGYDVTTKIIVYIDDYNITIEKL